MMSVFRNRITVVWIALVVATALSWESAQVGLADVRWLTTAVVTVAFIKVRYIGLEFMETGGTAPPALRIIFEVWVAAVCALLLAVYWLV